MLKIKPFRQKIGFCGPASLKMVLDYYGIKKSENVLGKITGRTAKKGTPANGILRAVKILGLKGFVKDFSNFNEIKYYLNRKIPVIVNWFSEDEGHYSVVVGIDKTNIYLQDPELGRIRRINLKVFKRIWFSFLGNFIKSNSKLILRRIIIIEK
jgi:predicted double-glycine peptidase